MEVWLEIKMFIKEIAVIFVITYFVIGPILNYYRVGFDDSDSDELGERSNLIVYTDYKTGLQYISSTKSDLHTRLNIDGTHMKKEN